MNYKSINYWGKKENKTVCQEVLPQNELRIHYQKKAEGPYQALLTSHYATEYPGSRFLDPCHTYKWHQTNRTCITSANLKGKLRL